MANPKSKEKLVGQDLAKFVAKKKQVAYPVSSLPDLEPSTPHAFGGGNIFSSNSDKVSKVECQIVDQSDVLPNAIADLDKVMTSKGAYVATAASKLHAQNVNLEQPKPKRMPTLSSILWTLRNAFSREMPWMALLFLSKQGKERYLFHCLSSLPALELGWFAQNHEKNGVILPTLDQTFGGPASQETVEADAGNQPVDVWIRSSWQGDNSPIFTLNRDHDLDEVLGTEEVQNVGWAHTALGRNAYTQAKLRGLDPSNYYTASSSILLSDVMAIDIFKWGFELRTNGPIEAIGIRKALLADTLVPSGTSSKPNYSGRNNAMTNESLFIKDVTNLFGKPFEMASENMDPSLIQYTWERDSGEVTNAELAEILAPHEAPVVEVGRIIDIGQKVNHNLDLE